MTTKTVMKAEIEAILARTDLTTEVGEAINHAIAEYQQERLFFKDVLSTTFDCVVGQVYYDGDDDADIPLFGQFDDIHIRISNNDYSLRRIRSIGEFEVLNDGNISNGQPTNFIYYSKSIGLYPPPDDTYTVTIFGGYDVAAPATDGEADNVWMTDGYRMVMNRALARMLRFYEEKYDKAIQMDAEAQRELDRLYTRTNRLKASGSIVPTQF